MNSATHPRQTPFIASAIAAHATDRGRLTVSKAPCLRPCTAILIAAFTLAALVFTIPAHAQTTTRPIAIPGSPVVIPITVRAGEPTEARLGTESDAGTLRLPTTLAIAEAIPPHARSWMGDVTRVMTRDLTDGYNGPAVAIITLPATAAGASLAINGRTIRPRWIIQDEAPTPALLTAATESPLTAEEQQDLGLRLALEPLINDPANAFRARLAFGILDDQSQTTTDPRTMLAHANAALWRTALLRLHRTDPGLAGQARRALVATIRFPTPQPNGTIAPVFIADDRAASELLAILLDPEYDTTLRPENLIDRVSAWLDTLPTLLIETTDTAGRPEPAFKNAPRLAITNLAQTATLAAVNTGITRGEPFTLEPLTARSTRPVREPGETSELRIADASIAIPPIVPISLTPPGATITGFTADWTMRRYLDTLARSTATRTPPRIPVESTTILLTKGWTSTPEPDRPTTASQAEQWLIYIECESPPARATIAADSIDTSDAVTLFAGPKGRPSLIVSIDRDGNISDASPTPLETLPKFATINTTDTGWSALLPVPLSALADADGLLRLGATRTAAGQRSAWPSPIRPWEDEPARAAFDPAAWSRESIRPRSP